MAHWAAPSRIVFTRHESKGILDSCRSSILMKEPTELEIRNSQTSSKPRVFKETSLQVLPAIENAAASSFPKPGGFEGYHLYITFHSNRLILQSFDPLQGWIRISITMTGQFRHKKIYTCPEGLEGGNGGDNGYKRTSYINQLHDFETIEVRST